MPDVRPATGLFLGLTTIDLQYVLDPFPRPNTKNKAQQFHLAVGGPAINAAATFAHLGGNATIYTVVGQHALTDYLKNDFQLYGMRLIDLGPQHAELPMMASVITQQLTGDRTIVTPRRSEALLDLTLLDTALEPAPDFILVDGFHMEAAIHLAQLGRKSGIPVIMDGGSWKARTSELLPFIDSLICSADFHLPDPTRDLFDCCRELGIKAVAITNGGSPIQYCINGKPGSLAVKPVRAVDTLGAGDVFHGAFCYFFAENKEFVSSLSLAAKVAGTSCQYLGARTWMAHTPA